MKKHNLRKEGDILLKDNNTIVTTKGFIEFYSNVRYFVKSIHYIPQSLLDGNTFLLREIMSYKLNKDEVIPVEDFYYDKWELHKYELTDIYEFIESLNNYRVSQLKDDFVVETFYRNNRHYIALFGNYYNFENKSLEFKVTTFSSDNREVIDELYRLVIFKYPSALIHLLFIAQNYNYEYDKMYYSFNLKQKNDKIREIYAPHEDVKRALRNLLRPLDKALDKRVKNTNQFAYIKNRSIKHNADIHSNNKYVVKCDIKSFFDYCTWEYIEKYLEFLFPKDIHNTTLDEYNTRIKDIIKNTIINPRTGGLYMGSPVSGVLSNMIMNPVTRYLENIFNEKDIAISVYADDITVSSNKPLSKGYVTQTIEYVFDFYNLPFILKEEKTKKLKNNGRRITGVRINHKDQLTVDRKNYKLMRSMCEYLKNDKSISMKKSEFIGKFNYYLHIDTTGKFRKLALKYNDVLIKKNIHLSGKLLDGQVEITDII